MSAVVTWLVGFAVTCAQPPAAPPTLAELDEMAAEVTSLKAAFEREKHSDLLLEPLVSTGTITVREGRIRWDTKQPRPSTVIVTRGTMIAREGDGAAEAYEIPESLARLSASPKIQFSALEETFAVTVSRGEGADADLEENSDGNREGEDTPEDATLEEKILLRLEPTDEDLREYVEWVTLELDPETAVATRIEYADPDGDRTVLRFTEIEINPEISESTFNPDNLR